MSIPEQSSREPKPPGRFKQSQVDNQSAVDEWIKGRGQIFFGVLLVILVIGCIYTAITR